MSCYTQESKKVLELHTLYQKEKYSNLQKANEYATKASILCKKINNDSLELISNYYLTEALHKQRLIKKAIKTAEKCISLAKNINNQRTLCFSYIYLSIFNRRLNNYSKSLQYLETALKIATKKKYKKAIHKIVNNKAILYKRTNNQLKARKILKKKIVKTDYNDPTETGYSYNILGTLYLPINKDSSVYFYKKALKTIEKTENNYAKTTFLLNLGDVLIQQKKYNKALKKLHFAKELALKTFDNESLFYIHMSLAIYYHDNEIYNDAIKNYLEAIEKYGKYVAKKQKAHLYWLISDALYFNNQFKKGFLYQEKYIELQDSLFTINKNKTFEKLQTEYEVDKKNTQIQFLQKEQILEAQQKKMILSIGGLILVALILLVIMYRYRINSQKTIRNQEQQLFLQEKAKLEQDQKIKHIQGYIEGEEKEKNRISMELHDGIGGQLSGIKHFISSLSESPKTKELIQNISTVSKEVRLLSHSLSSSYSLQQPFKNLLKTLQQRYENHFDIDITLFPEHEIDLVSDKQKLFLYRSIQELINNTYKYAKANLIHVSITISNEIVLIIEDNGIGFNSENTFNGIGLQNIKERTENLNGEFILDTVVNRGTSVIIKIPIKNDASN